MNKKFLYPCGFLIASFFCLFFADFSQAIIFENPLGTSDVNELVAGVLEALKNLIAVLAIVFIVIGGIMYMISTGNQGMMERAKKIITAALIGLVIALSAETFLIEIYDVLEVTGGPDEGLTFKEIAANVLETLLGIVGVLAIIGMLAGGSMMMTAYGSEERMKKGKTIVTYSIIGTVISLGSLVIVKQIAILILEN